MSEIGIKRFILQGDPQYTQLILFEIGQQDNFCPTITYAIIKQILRTDQHDLTQQIEQTILNFLGQNTQSQSFQSQSIISQFIRQIFLYQSSPVDKVAMLDDYLRSQNNFVAFVEFSRQFIAYLGNKPSLAQGYRIENEQEMFGILQYIGYNLHVQFRINREGPQFSLYDFPLFNKQNYLIVSIMVDEQSRYFVKYHKHEELFDLKQWQGDITDFPFMRSQQAAADKLNKCFQEICQIINLPAVTSTNRDLITKGLDEIEREFGKLPGVNQLKQLLSPLIHNIEAPKSLKIVQAAPQNQPSQKAPNNTIPLCFQKPPTPSESGYYPPRKQPDQSKAIEQNVQNLALSAEKEQIFDIPTNQPPPNYFQTVPQMNIQQNNPSLTTESFIIYQNEPIISPPQPIHRPQTQQIQKCQHLQRGLNQPFQYIEHAFEECSMLHCLSCLFEQDYMRISQYICEHGVAINQSNIQGKYRNIYDQIMFIRDLSSTTQLSQGAYQEYLQSEEGIQEEMVSTLQMGYKRL